ncbi:MAG: NADH-quinone oxidoreductase subunit I [Syntrophomonadaceae bacterium]|nr:NADH-quinone oxidoreductase subunit I [Syntrophomonadaceae bacterium]
MFGKGLGKGLAITLKHALAMDITIQYPEEKPFLEDRYRGSLVYQYEKCIACGLCIKACPNRVLALETFVPEGSKRKQVARYTIDRQYCLFCNLCVEICPTATLYFSHDFELTQFRREDIKVVYLPPQPSPIVPAGIGGTEAPPEAAAAEPAPAPEEADKQPAPPPDTAEGAKRERQVEAMQAALTKNPQKILAKLVQDEEAIELLAAMLGKDTKLSSKLAELMIADRDKAQKLAAGLITKVRKASAAEEVKTDEPS